MGAYEGRDKSVVLFDEGVNEDRGNSDFRGLFFVEERICCISRLIGRRPM